MTHPIFNQELFLQSLAGDRSLAHELLGAFMEDSPERLNSLGEALDAGDADDASRLAHSLKGMCGVVRAEELVGLALAMERSAKEGDLESTRERYARFKSLLDAVHDEMRAFMAA